MHVRRWFTIIHAWHGLHSKLSTDWTCTRTWMTCIILYHIALLCFKLHNLHRKNSSLKAEGSSTSRFWGVGTLLQRIGRCLRKRATAVRRHCVRELIMQQILRFLHLLAFTMSTFFIFFDIDFTSVILKVLLLLWFEESRAHHGFALPPVPGTVPTLRGDREFLATAQSQWCLLTTWHWWFRMILAKRRHLWISMASWVFDREMFYRELWFLTWAVVFSEVLNQAPRATSTTKCLLVSEDSDKAATELRYVLLNTFDLLLSVQDVRKCLPCLSWPQLLTQDDSGIIALLWLWFSTAWHPYWRSEGARQRAVFGKQVFWHYRREVERKAPLDLRRDYLAPYNSCWRGPWHPRCQVGVAYKISMHLHFSRS